MVDTGEQGTSKHVGSASRRAQQSEVEYKSVKVVECVIAASPVQSVDSERAFAEARHSSRRDQTSRHGGKENF